MTYVFTPFHGYAPIRCEKITVPRLSCSDNGINFALNIAYEPEGNCFIREKRLPLYCKNYHK